MIYCFFAAFPFVFSQAPYFFSPSQVGMTFLAIALGTVLASVTIVIIDRKIYVKKHEQAIRDGAKYARPEHRLYSSMLGSIGLPIGLFWFGWTAHHGVHWAVPVVAAIPFGWGNVCLFVSLSHMRSNQGNTPLTSDLLGLLDIVPDRCLWGRKRGIGSCRKWNHSLYPGWSLSSFYSTE